MRHTGRCRGSMRSLLSTLLGTNAPKLQLQQATRAVSSSSSSAAACSRRLRAAAGLACTEASAAGRSSARSRATPTSYQPLPGARRRYAGSSSSSSSPSPLPMQHQQEQQTKRAPVERGVVSPRRTVPDHIPKTPYYATGAVPPQDDVIHLHTAETLVPMRQACILARDMLDLCCAMAQPGVTTDEIDAAVHGAIIDAGACPSPLNYHGFPKVKWPYLGSWYPSLWVDGKKLTSVCSSVNEVACHAIPDDRPLQDGDLVSFDVSLFLNGFHGDNCATVGVGTVDAAGQRLMDATEEAMMAGVSVCRPGACLTEIGSAIHDVADRYGFDTVQKYCGHGVGSAFHMLPFVQHFRNNQRLELVPGMTFTIEPIFTEGSEATTLWPDAWTVQTVDGGRAAQFEHVVLVTEEGHEVLTVSSQSVSVAG